MAILANAAGRLHALIVDGLKCPNNMITRDAWGRILGVEAADISRLLMGLSAAIQLPSQAEAEVRQLRGVDIDHMLVWVPPVHAAFSALNLGEHWEKFRVQFANKGEALHTLQIAASMIAYQLPDRDVDGDVLLSLRNEAAALRALVVEAELDADLKVFILERLRTIEDALELYHIRGAAGLRDVVDRALGELVSRPAVRERIERTSVAGSYGQFLKNVLIAFSFTADSLAISQWSQDRLPPPPPAVQLIVPAPHCEEPPAERSDVGPDATRRTHRV